MSNLDVPDKEAQAPERISTWTCFRCGTLRIVRVGADTAKRLGGCCGASIKNPVEFIRTSHAIALISAKREEYQRISDNWNNLVANRASAGSKADACVELLALLTWENKDSECEAKGNLTTT